VSAINTLLSLGKRVEVWKIPNGEVAVSYQRCEIKEGIFFKSYFGTGDAFEQACEDYLRQLHGKTLVFNAYSSDREEIRVL